MRHDVSLFLLLICFVNDLLTLKTPYTHGLLITTLIYIIDEGHTVDIHVMHKIVQTIQTAKKGDQTQLSEMQSGFKLATSQFFL